MSKSGKSSSIVVFDDYSGDMITLGKRGKKYMDAVKASGNMGTGGGRLLIITNSSNKKFYEQFE